MSEDEIININEKGDREEYVGKVRDLFGVDGIREGIRKCTSFDQYVPEKQSWDLFQLFLTILRAKLLCPIPLSIVLPLTLDAQNEEELEVLISFAASLSISCT